MTTLETNVEELLKQISETALLVHRKAQDIKVVAVSKGAHLNQIKEAYCLGVRDFGESRVQEALKKMPLLPVDIRWHFIGRLQKNKVSHVVGKFTLIHSVDSLELAEKLSEVSVEKKVTTSILLQVNTSKEATKAGFSIVDCKKYFPTIDSLPSLVVEGLMTMAPLREEESVIRKCFRDLRLLQEELEMTSGNQLKTLSMGMSNDFHFALQEGATLLRIGSKLFEPCERYE